MVAAIVAMTIASVASFAFVRSHVLGHHEGGGSAARSGLSCRSDVSEDRERRPGDLSPDPLAGKTRCRFPFVVSSSRAGHTLACRADRFLHRGHGPRLLEAGCSPPHHYALIAGAGNGRKEGPDRDPRTRRAPTGTIRGVGCLPRVDARAGPWICRDQDIFDRIHSSPELYELLALRQGWTLDCYGRFVGGGMIAALLPRPA